MFNQILFTLIIVMFNYHKFDCQEILDLSCTTNVDCEQFKLPGHNVTCSNGECICNGIDSKRIECSPKNQELLHNLIGKQCPCHIKHSDCDNILRICLCKVNYIPSFDKLRCIKKSVQLNEPCEDHSQCISSDHFSICDHTENICKCQKHFVNHNGVCLSTVGLGEKCQSNIQCSNQTKNSLCSDEMRCVCDRNFVSNEHKTECLPSAGYGDSCKITDQCKHKLGPGSECYSGNCTCDVRHYLNIVGKNENEKICERYIDLGDYCKENNDCYQYHLKPHEQSMKCILGECTCRDGFQPDTNKKICLEGSANSIKFNWLSLIISILFLKFFY